MPHWKFRMGVGATAVTALTAVLLAPVAQADEHAAADDVQMLLVHGYGDANKGKDCNGDTWKDAIEYYTDSDAGNMHPSSITTIGYYTGDSRADCDAIIGADEHGIPTASNDTPIQEIARNLAHYIDDQNEPVNVVAHSMGGLITRVALLGSAQGWDDFPKDEFGNPITLDVGNVVTLGTPHDGLRKAVYDANDDTQWNQMSKYKAGEENGFYKRLHREDSGLGEDWALVTDWTLIGSNEDDVVCYDSAIDKGRAANQKFGYKNNGGTAYCGEDRSGSAAAGADKADQVEPVTHTTIRTSTTPHEYRLNYWHQGHDPHKTNNGWAPLKAAFKAATYEGDDLPK